MKYLIIIALLLTVSCGKRDGGEAAPQSTVTIQPTPDTNTDTGIVDPVPPTVTPDKVTSKWGFYEEQGSSTESLRIKCAPNGTVKSYGYLIFNISTGNGGTLRIWRNTEGSADIEEVYLKANSIYYLKTQITTKQTFGVQYTDGSTGGGIATCQLPK